MLRKIPAVVIGLLLITVFPSVIIALDPSCPKFNYCMGCSEISKGACTSCFNFVGGTIKSRIQKGTHCKTLLGSIENCSMNDYDSVHADPKTSF